MSKYIFVKKKGFKRRRGVRKIVPSGYGTIRGNRLYKRTRFNMTPLGRTLFLTSTALVLITVIVILLLIGGSPVKEVSFDKGDFFLENSFLINAEMDDKVFKERVSFHINGESPEKVNLSSYPNVEISDYREDGEYDFEVRIDGKTVYTSSFIVDATPPLATVESIEETEENKISITCRIEPETVIIYNDEQINSGEEGVFTVDIDRRKGFYITLEMIDRAGNVNRQMISGKPPVALKGVHCSMAVAGSEELLGILLDMAERTELNAIQIDVKNENGDIAYMSSVDMAREIESALSIYDPERIVDKLWYRKVFPICRIAVFKDPKLVGKRPDLAVQNASGQPWGNGTWVDPYSIEVWEYNIELAIEAVKKGFKEVQFDYVRFPSDGDTTACVYPNSDDRSFEQVIGDFLAYARERLKPYGAIISADVYGLTGASQGAMGIGQDAGIMAKHLDYMCPMIYPAQYNRGEFGFQNPEANPYEVVKKSVEEFKKAIEGTNCKLRPWLQDFTVNIGYGYSEVREQIQAVEDNDIKEWLLWNPNSVYSERALNLE